MEARCRKKFVGGNKLGCRDASDDSDGLTHSHEGLGDTPIQNQRIWEYAP